MEITKLCWNPAYKDLFAASYGSYNFYDQDAVTNGVVCVFSLKNPSYPEYLCTAQAGLFCWQWFAYSFRSKSQRSFQNWNGTFWTHRISLVVVQCGIIAVDVHPDHPHMLAAGLADGNVAVYNLQEKSQKPKYISTARNGKHQDIVWQVTTYSWLPISSIGPNSSLG